MKKLYTIAAASVAAAVAIGCGSVVKHAIMTNPKVQSVFDQPHLDRTLTHQGHVETIGDDENRMTVLYVSGTPYEMGYEHGRLLSDDVHATIRDIMAGAMKLLPKDLRNSTLISERDKRDIINTLLDRAWRKLRPFTPREDLEEMVGLAEGSGVPLHVIHRLHAIPDLSETSCSALLAKDTATRDGHIYQLRILDYSGTFNLQKRPLITVYRPNNANAFVNIGWIGFIGVVSGMNEKSVALCEMGAGSPPGETLAGVPMPFLLKNVLRYADTADEATVIIRGARRTNSYVYLFGDKNGGAVGLITTAQQFLAYRANELEQVTFDGKQYPQFRDILYAGHYQTRQAALMRDLRGSFDVPAIQDVACQIAMKSNLHTVIYDLTDGKIWVANRKDNIRACDRPYVEFHLADAWAKYLDAPAPITTAARSTN